MWINHFEIIDNVLANLRNKLNDDYSEKEIKGRFLFIKGVSKFHTGLSDSRIHMSKFPMNKRKIKETAYYFPHHAVKKEGNMI